jgi:hypothetical protein
VQSAVHRRKRLLVADVHSTMIGQECIDELADGVGLNDRIAPITERAMRGDIAFEPALRERVALLAGLPVAAIGKVFCCSRQGDTRRDDPGADHARTGLLPVGSDSRCSAVASPPCGASTNIVPIGSLSKTIG